jgi:hypothetical protein
MELYELAKRVDSKETFLEFVAALRADWEMSRAEEKAKPSSSYGPKARDWENPELGLFLEQMQAWTEDMGDEVSPQASWQTFAFMLMAGKGYE